MTSLFVCRSFGIFKYVSRDFPGNDLLTVTSKDFKAFHAGHRGLLLCVLGRWPHLSSLCLDDLGLSGWDPVSGLVLFCVLQNPLLLPGVCKQSLRSLSLSLYIQYIYIYICTYIELVGALFFKPMCQQTHVPSSI